MAKTRKHSHSPASTVADAGSRQLALVYAKALLAAAVSAGQSAGQDDAGQGKAGQAEALLAEFDSFIADVLNAFPDWEKVLASALVRVEEKVELLDRALGKQASPLFLNILKVLAQHGRLDCLRPIHRAMHDLYQQQHGKVPVHVSTATPLGEEQAGRIADVVRRMLDQEPELVTRTDPTLIGGMVLRIGDTVYDASIVSRLEQIRSQMINRSVHEIQSRRDRFRHPAGN